MESFGELLRTYREAAGYSQNGLAKRVGVTPSYVNRLERGERAAPTREVVAALAGSLELPVGHSDRLALAAGYAPAALVMLGAGDETISLVANILVDQSIPEKERDDFRLMVRMIAKRWRPNA